MVGKPRSCVGCRQSKLACDARIRAPEPCRRCVDRNIECRFDSNFKRIPTRQLTLSLTRELQNMRESQHSGNSGSSSVGEPVLEIPRDTTPNRAEYTIQPDDEPFFSREQVEAFHDMESDGLYLSAHVVTELLEHFGRCLYPHAQYLEPIGSPSRVAAESPLLFWTIMMISTQQHETYHFLCIQLGEVVRKMLSPMQHNTILTIQEVHALLLLCQWPDTSQPSRLLSSWTFLSLAINACINLDLHKPAPQDDSFHWTTWYRSVPRTTVSYRIQRLTWLNCFRISTQESIYLGFVPPLASYHHIRYVRKAVAELGGPLSSDYSATTALYECMCNYMVALDDVQDPSENYLMAQQLSTALDSVKQQFLPHWPQHVDLLFHFAKLNLNATALTRYLRAERRTARHNIDMETLFSQGLRPALQLIDCFQTLVGTSSDAGQSRIVYLPRGYYGVLLFAAIHLFRLLATSQSTPQADRARAHQGLRDTLAIFRLVPRNTSIMFGALMVEKLQLQIDQERALGAASPMHGIAISNRLGASIMWDTILYLTNGTQRRPVVWLTGTKFPTYKHGIWTRDASGPSVFQELGDDSNLEEENISLQHVTGQAPYVGAHETQSQAEQLYSFDWSFSLQTPAFDHTGMGMWS
ncbi:hypothetical protein F5Y15DRAFT_60380 [Xylariaceae sp. FL0016]|nr:hypothetical protein F5Y15DRAFT_60380 [Xylariaceae sp. FL0016]